MGLIRSALRKPISILVIVVGLFFFGVNAVRNIKIDIFPELNLPVIYISHPYGGFTPTQMEAFFAKNYVNLLLYVSGVKSIETRNIQGLTLIKLTFYQGTNMAQAAAEVATFTNRAQAIFPNGSQPPFILRFDASTLPIGELVLSSKIRSNNELMDLANVYVRASFTSIPGLVSPAPFGGNVRTVVIKVNPELLRVHHLTPDQVVEALRNNNQATPAGNVRIGDYNYYTPANTTLKNIKDFGDIPIYKGTVENLYLRDIAVIEDGADITTSYALVNGKRSIYMPVTKSADASTWEVVQNLKKALPRFQSLLPDDVSLSYEFDQSVYVINAVKSLITEGAIGALLTGLMVLLFLGDRRGALIVVLTIPTSIISGVLFLYLFNQTINIMTLSGLALAIGILVDESTVTIENIHQHLALGKPKALAIWDACKEIAFPKLLILLCILAVFAPAFTMTGIPGSLFLPLAMAIAFSMITSYFLAQTFVPIMANWLMKAHHHTSAKDGHVLTDEEEYAALGLTAAEEQDTWDQKKKLLEKQMNNGNGKLTRFDKFRNRFLRFLDRLFPYQKSVVIMYTLVTCGLVFLLINTIGRDVLPKVNSGQFQVRLRAPDGTRMERTEEKTITALHILEELVGKDNISVTSAFVGQHPGQFSTSPIYLFMSGPQEAVIQVALKDSYKEKLDHLKESFREKMKADMPDVRLSFEPIELTDKVLSQGSSTPIEVRITGKDKKLNEVYAGKVIEKLRQIEYMRDVQLAQPTKYPTLDIDIDRTRAAQMGVSLADISRSLVAATSSSRYTEKSVWIDPKSNISYGVQVEIPENQMNSTNDINEIPVLNNASRPVLGDVATVKLDTTYGENDNQGAIPFLTVTANLYNKDLGTATKDVKEAIQSMGELPRGLSIEMKGLSEVLSDTLSSLQLGLITAIAVIFL